ncbi:uncharacterized protein LOC130940194 isoform X2 [Arachis stenosperma]|uniref:uncharacterized protein LOC130940194 isoform X2 n=1 Tax=Arachis stenosperma TaxID=217475 RepID=UPI0025AC8780|nr:uncharacterized protein LOC130940194 isoform X2 [Arachis stenosperma]
MMQDNLQVPKTREKMVTFSVGVGSAVFALLSYACSSTFQHLFGELNSWWKIIVYTIFSLITLVAVVVLSMLTTVPDVPRFGDYAGAIAMGISSVLIEGPPQKYLVHREGNREKVVRLVLAFLPVESWCYVLVQSFHDDAIFRDDDEFRNYILKVFKIMVPLGYCYLLSVPYFLTRMLGIWKFSRLPVFLEDYMRFIMSLVIMYHIYWEGISDFWVIYGLYIFFVTLTNVAIGRRIFIFLELGMIYVELVLPISFAGLPIRNQLLLLGFSFIGFVCSVLIITYLTLKYGKNDPVIQERSQDPRPAHGVAPNTASQSRETSSSSPYVGVGLENLGNTCFMNVILQCFTHTVPFIQELRSFYQHTPCSNNDKGLCVFWALCEIIDALLLNSSGAPVHPEKLANNLSYFSADFVKGRQCDAHEFMQCALDKLKECFPDGEDNPVDKIFSGEIVSKFSYSGCDHDQPPSYTTPEPLNLMLDMDGVKSVEKALESFFKVDKTEQITCDTCGIQVSRRQQIFLNKTPKIAALKLNRIKKDEYVDFPMDLDLKPYYTNKDPNENVILTYYLYAVVVHSGENLNSGHYYCFVRTSENNWCKYDDSKATEASESEVVGEEAYILFYAQQGTPWFVNSMSVLKDTRMDENAEVGMSISSDQRDIRKNLLTRTQKSGDISSPRKRRPHIPI